MDVYIYYYINARHETDLSLKKKQCFIAEVKNILCMLF